MTFPIVNIGQGGPWNEIAYSDFGTNPGSPEYLTDPQGRTLDAYSELEFFTDSMGTGQVTAVQLGSDDGAGGITWYTTTGQYHLGYTSDNVNVGSSDRDRLHIDAFADPNGRCWLNLSMCNIAAETPVFGHMFYMGNAIRILTIRSRFLVAVKIKAARIPPDVAKTAGQMWIKGKLA